MLKKIKFSDIKHRKNYCDFDIKNIKSSNFDENVKVRNILSDIVKRDAVIQTTMMQDDFYEKNFGIISDFSKLKDGFNGYVVEDVKEGCCFEYISEMQKEVKIDFFDKLFLDRGFRYNGALCVSSKTVKELTCSNMLEAIKNNVEHLYLCIYPTCYDNIKNYYIKWLIWI